MIMQALYDDIEGLKRDAMRHKSKTLSRQDFKERARTVYENWHRLKSTIDKSTEEFKSIDDKFETLLSLTNRVPETRLYRSVLKELSTSLYRSSLLPPVSRSRFDDVFDSLDLHPRVREVCGGLFRDGHYASAVLEAFKAVNQAVKLKSRLGELDGQKLMNRAFDENNPVLKLNALSNVSDRDEQQGYRFIFAGVMIGIRNPKAHEIIRLNDPIRTCELLTVASLLMKHVDSSSVVENNTN